MSKPTPYEPEFWPVMIRRDGCAATRAEMCEAFSRWARRGDGLYAGLASILGAVAADKSVGDYPFVRVADAMIQRARKAGWASYSSGRWTVRSADDGPEQTT